MDSAREYYEDIAGEISQDPKLQREIVSALSFYFPKVTSDKRKLLIEKLKQKFSNRNVPRKLTEEELDEIVSFSVPKTMSAIPEIGEDNNRQIKEFVKNELREHRMVVTDENMSKLKKEIRERFYRSLVAPGQSVGVEVAMSFGQPLTQLSLDAFHSSGSRLNISANIKALEELFNVSEKKRRSMTTVHFKNKDLTYEEVIREGKAFKDVNMKFLIENSAIRTSSREEDKWWRDNYISMFIDSSQDREAVNENVFLRLKLNVSRCYSHGITVKRIMQVLNDKTFVCVCSPLSIGLIDIHPRKHVLSDTINSYFMGGGKDSLRVLNCDKKKLSINFTPDQSYSEIKTLFLTSIIQSCLKDIIINGIPGVISVQPATQSVISLLSSSKHPSSPLYWIIRLDYRSFKYLGIPSYKVKRLLSETKLGIVENNLEIDGKLHDNSHIIVASKQDPIELMNTMFNDAHAYIKKQVKEISEKETYKLPEYPPIYRAARYIYAEVDGEKISRKLMRHPKLDNKFIIPNNPNEVYQLFGIETARFYMFREYIRLIETSGSFISPCHINLLVDYQTFMGFLTPIHALGASKQGVSSLSAAAFKDPVGVFQKAAAMGKKDKISSISSCIMAGKRCLNGTGFSDVEMESSGTFKPESRPKPKSKLGPKFQKRVRTAEQKLVMDELPIKEKGPPDHVLPPRETKDDYIQPPSGYIPSMPKPSYLSQFSKGPSQPSAFSPPSSPSYMPTSPTEPPPGSPSYMPISPSDPVPYSPKNPTEPPPGSPSYMPISPSDPVPYSPQKEISGGYKPSSYSPQKEISGGYKPSSYSPTYGPDSPNADYSPTYGPDSPNTVRPSPLITSTESPKSDDDIPDMPDVPEDDVNLSNW